MVGGGYIVDTQIVTLLNTFINHNTQSKMKRIALIFTMIVSLVAFSCVTDTTQEIDYAIGGAEQTTITLSLEESRTQLGDKVGDLYPLYWSEGDQISVNGVASNILTAEQAGSSKATFVVSGTLQTPYCIAYPTAAEGKVLFAEKQSHAGNTTFGNGVSTMYGYSNDGIGAQLTHLTGVLKLGIVGSAKLSMAQISTIDRAPIAGEFNFDFESGEATATEASKDVIEYSFGEGVQLSTEPTYIHVAVPAGVYEELYITLYDINGGVMYARVKADDAKPLTAGNVRAFSNTITYASANQTLFVVSSAATLKSFAEQAASLSKDVLFVADVDMSSEEWTPIEGYTGTINGNGYAIKGLKAPLFGTTSAKIKGLHLKGVNQEWTTLTHGGLFACDMNEGGMLSHCSAEGKVLINNTTYKGTAERSQYDIIYGGLVGYVAGTTIDNCTNCVDITVQSVADTSDTDTKHGLSLGGIAGASDLVDGGTATSITNVANYGEIYFTSTVKMCGGYYWVGGVFGQTINDLSISNFHHCYNYGKIHTVADCFVHAIRVGGVFGDLGVINPTESCDFIQNHGELDVRGQSPTSAPIVCGIGYTLGGSSSNKLAVGANDCLNTGNVTVQVSANSNVYVCGGILGMYCGVVSNRVKNEGNITVLRYKETTIGGTLTVGGLGNNHYSDITGTADNPSGNSGNISVSAAVGGNVTITGLANKTYGVLTNVANSGDITFTGSSDAEALTFGIATEVRAAYKNVTNSGNILSAGTSGTNTAVYGIARLVYVKMTNVHNTGNVTCTGTATAGTIQIAGVCGALGNYSVTTNANNPSSNSGTITFSGKSLDSSKEVKVAGYAVILNYNKGMADLLNKGKVHYVATTDNLSKVSVGGVACDINFAIEDCENRGELVVTGTAATAVNVSAIGHTVKGTLTNVKNSGKLTSTATHNKEIRLSGIVGPSFTGVTIENAVNTGDIEFNGAAKSGLGVAGIWAVNQAGEATLKNCHNKGAITVISSATNASSNHVAGLVGYTSKSMTFDGCSNSNNSAGKGIYVDQTVKHGYFDISGGIGYVYGKAAAPSAITFLNGFTNSADIHTKAIHTYASGYPVAGVIGTYQLSGASYEGWTGTIKNTGKITFDGDASASKTLAVGGIIGISGAASEATLVNTGDIAITDTAKIPATNGFGGIVGVTTGTIKGAKAHFTLEKSKNVAANVGFITGSARSATVTASECAIGGRILTGWDDSDTEPEPIYTKLNTGNYYNYIYGSGNATDWTGTDNYDGCTYISSAPTL